MNVFLTAFLYLLVKSVPYHLLAYYPYRGCLRSSPVKTIARVAVIQLFQCVLFGLAAYGGKNTQLVEYAFAAVYMAVYFYSIRADRFRLLFLYLFVMDYTIVLRGVSAFLEVRFFYYEGMTLYSLRSTFISVALSAISLPFLLRFFARTREKVFAIDAPALWRTVWLIPAFSSLVVLLYTGADDMGEMRSLRFLISRLMVMGSMFVVYFILLEALSTIREQAALSERANMQERLLTAQETQYRQLVRHVEEVRTARHDLRQHLGILRACLDSGDTEKLLRYLDSYELTLPADTRKTFCKNFAVNAVLSYYAEEAEKSKTDFDADCLFPETLPVNEPELCALIGNLLENAVEACRNAAETAPFIRVRGRCEDGTVTLTVDNSSAEEPVQENGRFLSGKHKGFGTGTYSVRTTAQRSGGTAEFSYEDGVFYVSVLLYGQEELS